MVIESFDTGAVYAKTALGQQEITTRALRLPPRVRMALIVVDGKRRGAELLSLIAADGQAALSQLIELGCIEPTSAPVRVAAVPVAAAAPMLQIPATMSPALAAAAASSPSLGDLASLPPASSRSKKQVEMARNFMTNTTNTMFGQNMRLSLIEAIFNAQDADELRAVYPSWADTMAADRSAAKRLPDLRKKLFDVL